jgi:hypothetical protein
LLAITYRQWMPNIQPQFLQLLGHPGPAIAAKTGAVLVLDMRKQDPVRTLAARRRSTLPSTQTSIRDSQKLTQMHAWQQTAVPVNEHKPHCF